MPVCKCSDLIRSPKITYVEEHLKVFFFSIYLSLYVPSTFQHQVMPLVIASYLFKFILQIFVAYKTLQYTAVSYIYPTCNNSTVLFSFSKLYLLLNTTFIIILSTKYP